jgi:hypothetical protein
MQDDVGFQSQVFNEQVANRRDRYAQQNIQTSQQMSQLPSQFMGAMRARQQMDLERQKVASELANDELHRQDAIQKLQWARELHTTDMIQMQRDAAKLDLDLKRAQVEKMHADMQPDQSRMFDSLTPDRAIATLALGIVPKISNGRVIASDADPKLREAAMKMLMTQTASGADRTNRIVSLDLERAEKAYQRAEESGDETGMDVWQNQIDVLRQEMRGMSGAAAPAPKAAPKPQESAQFKQRVKDFTVTDPGLASVLGASNAEKLYGAVLRDIDKYKASLEKHRKTALSDTEAANIVSQTIQAGVKNPESQGYALLQWLLQDGTLDPEEFNLATQRAETKRLRDVDASEMSLRAGF